VENGGFVASTISYFLYLVSFVNSASIADSLFGGIVAICSLL
jgi:hypothetical protein